MENMITFKRGEERKSINDWKILIYSPIKVSKSAVYVNKLLILFVKDLYIMLFLVNRNDHKIFEKSNVISILISKNYVYIKVN